MVRHTVDHAGSDPDVEQSDFEPGGMGEGRPVEHLIRIGALGLGHGGILVMLLRLHKRTLILTIGNPRIACGKLGF